MTIIILITLSLLVLFGYSFVKVYNRGKKYLKGAKKRRRFLLPFIYKKKDANTVIPTDTDTK